METLRQVMTIAPHAIGDIMQAARTISEEIVVPIALEVVHAISDCCAFMLKLFWALLVKVHIITGNGEPPEEYYTSKSL